MMINMSQMMTKIEGKTQQMIFANAQAISKLEMAMSQLAKHMTEREKGTFPSQTVENPRPNQPLQNQGMSHVNAIYILRSGKEVDNHVVIPNQDPPVFNQSFSPLVDKSKESNYDHQSSTINEEESETTTERVYEPPVPYLNRLRPKKHSAQVEKTLEIFKQVKVNIPLLDVIEQVPSYARFLNDLCTRKRKTKVPREYFLHLTSRIWYLARCR